jgi:hypothetical protein
MQVGDRFRCTSREKAEENDILDLVTLDIRPGVHRFQSAISGESYDIHGQIAGMCLVPLSTRPIPDATARSKQLSGLREWFRTLGRRKVAQTRF